jgi:hypothetical protein
MPSNRESGNPVEAFPNSVPGAAELFAWFGHWPSFHDAEIISLVLNRSGLSVLRVHTWNTTGEVDERDCYIKEKHVVVSFEMEEILSLDLTNFSQQNVLFGMEILKGDQGWELIFNRRYGLRGSISVRRLSIEFEPVPACPQ